MTLTNPEVSFSLASNSEDLFKSSWTYSVLTAYKPIHRIINTIDNRNIIFLVKSFMRKRNIRTVQQHPKANNPTPERNNKNTNTKPQNAAKLE